MFTERELVGESKDNTKKDKIQSGLLQQAATSVVPF